MVNNTEKSIDVKQNIVLDKLYKMITSGYFRFGENLSERETAALIGVSRTPVRDAFRRLEKEGLVIYEPKKGFAIRSFTVDQIVDLYRIREYLEGLMARLMTERKNTALLIEMRKNIALSKEASKNVNIEEQAKINDQFHEMLAQGSGNEALINTFTPLRAQLSLLRSKTIRYEGRSINTITEHNNICDAIESGDPDQAENAARIHAKNGLFAAINNFNTLEMG